jgi:prepilin-type N-terminal cleavage/methylation domain-containing protein
LHRRSAFTLIEMMVAVALFGIVIATVGPNMRRSSVSTKGAALALAAALTEARQQAITQQVPVALVIPSGNGTQGQADSYYIAAGEQPRISQVKWFGGEQPGLRLMVGHWPLDTSKLQTPTLTTTITPPPETTFESDLDVSLWNLSQPKDFAFIFTPRGKIVTNGLPHFDGAYHILVSHGGQSTVASAPGASGLPTARNPQLFAPTQVGSPYTVTIDLSGSVTVSPGVVGAPDVTTYIQQQARITAAAAPPTLDPPPSAAPTIRMVSLLPDPARQNLPAGANILLAAGSPLTITTRARSPQRAPLFCQWTAASGGVSSAASLRMTYLPASAEWESTWHWQAPSDAKPGDRFTIKGRVHDGQGNQTPAYLSSRVDPVIAIGEDSPQILFRSTRGSVVELCSINGDGTKLRKLTDGLNNDAWPAWSPDGTRVSFGSWRAGRLEIRTMNADGSDQRKVSPDSPGGDYSSSLSPDGTRFCFLNQRHGNHELYTMNADGSDLRRLTNNLTSDIQPTWSPDGTRIVYTANRSGKGDIHAINPDGTGDTRLTDDPESDYHPKWSPDGKKILFLSNRTGTYELFVMKADGSGQTQLTTNINAGTNSNPSWSPDGTKITFKSEIDHKIYLIESDGTGLRKLTNHARFDSDPVWSPDGTRIIFCSNLSGNYEIHSIKSDGSDLLNLTKRIEDDGSPALR